MIRPASLAGAAFGTASDGDPRTESERRATWAETLAIPADWAWLRQVHGVVVHRAIEPGLLGDGDAAFTTENGLPIAVATADCFPVIVESAGAVGVAHAGWRGTAAGVVPALLEAMTDAGVPPVRAAIGPGIGPCCFEVGPEVAERFPEARTRTSWGTESVDLTSVLRRQLAALDVEVVAPCTMSDEGFHSFRRDRTELRQVAVAWLPS